LLNLFRRKAVTEKALEPTRKSWFERLTQVFSRSQVDESLWQELEQVLLGADVGSQIASQLIARVREAVAKSEKKDSALVRALLREEMLSILSPNQVRGSFLEQEGDFPKPMVVLVIGVNGVGKTTSIAKLASAWREQGKEVILAAADTFRAAAIEQLKVWGERASATVIAHRPGADPGAVTYDAYQAAKSRKADLLIVDTAGRLHTKTNLMEELKKVRRVLSRLDPTAPHEVLLVIDATTGQNGLMQAKAFVEAVQVSGVFLAKLDGTAKGGIVFAISRELGLPILYLGTGEKLEDLSTFAADEFVEALFA